MLFRELYAGFLFFVESKRKRNRELCSLPRCISIAETGILIEKDGCCLLKKRGIILENRAGGYTSTRNHLWRVYIQHLFE